MGANQSNATGHGMPSGAKVSFNVLKISPNSPASQANLIPYFDYILSVNGVTVIQEMPNVVAEMAKSHLDRPMRMSVYNSRNNNTREVIIVPTTKWGGDGLLGCSIRFCSHEGAIDRVWRILDSTPDSPGFKAGLIPLKDWIIGSADLALRTEDDFYQLLIHNKKRPVKLIVFNIDTNGCREVSVVPDFDWGGTGCLGCDIGTGLLNRVPADACETMSPRITDNQNESNIQGTPADVVKVEETPKTASPEPTLSTVAVPQESHNVDHHSTIDSTPLPFASLYTPPLPSIHVPQAEPEATVPEPGNDQQPVAEYPQISDNSEPLNPFLNQSKAQPPMNSPTLAPSGNENEIELNNSPAIHPLFASDTPSNEVQDPFK